ncbi:hypothetical protein AB0F71_14420 [Kitasatospora sp. NPDC028055]
MSRRRSPHRTAVDGRGRRDDATVDGTPTEIRDGIGDTDQQWTLP